jgi:RimJ/RimL family protein N-acetyltransferase
LRPFEAGDAAEVTRLVSDRRIADTTRNIAHPYRHEMAEQWIASLGPNFQAGTQATFAVMHAADHTLMGAIGLTIARADQRAEMGYWLGVPFWGQGYTTEAATALLRYGFTELGLHRIMATHIARNPASGRVMQKIGMRYEGTLRDHYAKNDAFEDVVYYAILLPEWQTQQHAEAAPMGAH